MGRDRVAFGATVAFALSMYASIANVVPALTVLRPALLASTVAFVALFGGRLFRRQAVSLGGVAGVALLGVVALAAASVGWSVYPAFTKEVTVRLAKEAAVFLTVVNVITTQRRLRAVLLACLVGGLAPALGCLQNYLDGTDLVEGFRARWVDVYGDPNHLAMSMVFLAPVALTALRLGRGWERALAGASLAASCAAIAVTHSRGGALGLALAFALWAVRDPQRSRATLSLCALLAAFAVLAPKSFWDRTETIADYQRDESALGRTHAWEVTRAINLDRPMLGVGFGGFVAAWPIYAPLDARGGALVAHNVFLEVLGDLGYLGFCLYLAFVAAALTQGFRAGRAPGPLGAWARAAFAGACGYLFCDTISGDVTLSHFFLAFGLQVAAERATRAGPAEAKEPGVAEAAVVRAA